MEKKERTGSPEMQEDKTGETSGGGGDDDSVGWDGLGMIKWLALKPRLLDLHYVGEHPLDLWWLLGGKKKFDCEA